MQSLLRNKIEGVTKGFLVYLRIQGIGYRATLKDQTLQFKLGYSHDITYELPPAMRAFLPEPTLVGLYGIDKNQVQSAAACVMRGAFEMCHMGRQISALHRWQRCLRDSERLPELHKACRPCVPSVALSTVAAVQVTQAAANIIRLRPPSVYKGKGIRLADTTPRTKPGKRK